MKLKRLLDQSIVGIVVITCLMIYLAASFGYQAVYDATLDEIREREVKNRIANEVFLQSCLREQSKTGSGSNNNGDS